MSQHEFYEIVWLDAQTSTASTTLEEAKKKLSPILSRSVGMIMHQNDEYILLAFTSFGKNIFKHWQVIPKGMIKEKKKLKQT